MPRATISREILYSRQSLLFGQSSDCILEQSSVIIFEVNYVTLETAKNLGLSGLAKIFIVCSAISKKNRLFWKMIVESNKQLSQKIQIIEEQTLFGHQNWFLTSNVASDGDDDTFREFVRRNGVKAMISTEYELFSDRLRRLNELSRKHGISFLCSGNAGLLAFIFVDVGSRFPYSIKAEIPNRKLVQSFTVLHSQQPIRVMIKVADKKHQFIGGSMVRINHQFVSSHPQSADRDHDGSDDDDKNRVCRLIYSISVFRVINDAVSDNQFIVEQHANNNDDDDDDQSSLSNASSPINDMAIELIERMKGIEIKLHSGFSSSATCEEIAAHHLLSHCRTLEENMEGRRGRRVVSESPRYNLQRDRTTQTVYQFFLGLSLFMRSFHRFPTRSEHDFQLFLDGLIAYDEKPPSSSSSSSSSSSPSPDGEEEKLVDILNMEMLKSAVYQSGGFVPSIGNVTGGILAHEALKIIHHSHSPITQWFFFESLASLPSSYLSLPPSLFLTSQKEDNREGEVINDDADQVIVDGDDCDQVIVDQVKVFGKEIQRKIENRKVLMVGAGALGCEFLKLFAVMGLSVGDEGIVYICDADEISHSNLHRQFLFNDHDVGTSKAETAASRIQSIYQTAFQSSSSSSSSSYSSSSSSFQGLKNMKIEAINGELTCQNMQKIFKEQIFEEITEIISAVDTAQAREEMCLISYCFDKSFLESGTRGSQCSASCYLPYITSRYLAPGGGFDVEFNCLGREFPFRPRHTIGWAKDHFDFYYSRSISNYLQIIQTHPHLRNSTHHDGDHQFEDCLEEINAEYRPTVSLLHRMRNDNHLRHRFCYHLFVEFFIHKINSLLTRHPPNSLDSSGEMFWRDHRICPSPLNEPMIGVDEGGDDTAAVDRFITHYLLNDTNDDTDTQSSLISQFVRANIALLDLVFTNESNDDDSGEEGSGIRPQYYEKDNAVHIQFIHATANLYSICFRIPIISVLETQIISGQITPAIITISSICVALITLEFYKLLHLDGDDRSCQVDGYKRMNIYSYNSYQNQLAKIPLLMLRKSKDIVKDETSILISNNNNDSKITIKLFNNIIVIQLQKNSEWTLKSLEPHISHFIEKPVSRIFFSHMQSKLLFPAYPAIYPPISSYCQTRSFIFFKLESDDEENEIEYNYDLFIRFI